jgi:hypothetical protein
MDEQRKLQKMSQPKRNPGDFLLSLPERLLRVLSAGLGGLVYQLSLVLFPERIRRSRLYQATIERFLRIIVELLGGVQGAFPAEAMSARELATRKAAGNVIELASFVAVGWSPVWLLAAAADILGGSQVYLHALVQDLQREGVLDPHTQVDSIEELLGELEQTLGQAADTVDLPPLYIEDMRTSWMILKERAAHLPDTNSLARIYADLKAVAQKEGQSVYRTSSLIAQGAVRTGIEMGNLHIFEYYRNALDAIALEGIGRYIQRISRPYQQAVSAHLNPGNQTFTERYLSRRRQERQSDSKVE